MWGGVRPAAGSEKVTIQFRRSGSGSFAALKSLEVKGPRGSFQTTVRLPASGQLRLAWKGSLSRFITVKRG